MKKHILLLCVAALSFILFACGGTEVNPGGQSATAQQETAVSTDAPDVGSNAAVETKEEVKEEVMEGKQVIVYFPNWKLNTVNGNVSDIPWDKVTIINHAFWGVVPDDGSTETSFERRRAGAAARTKYRIVSTLPEADEIIFKEYEKYSGEYPDVKILISIGGWSACGYFSEMAYTPEGRASMIASTVELMKANPWIDGIDIDWEYPSGSNDGERLPESDADQGCPIWGSQLDDRINFVAFLKELREGMEKEFGAGNKLLTACASSSTGWTLPNQDWLSASEQLDYINIMTYDMAGDWDKMTGHASGVSGTKNAMAYFVNKMVDKTKLNIGAPFYGTGFRAEKTANLSVAAVGVPIIRPNNISKEMLNMSFIRELEAKLAADGEPGWHRGYDERPGGAYLYNDDPESDMDHWYISYECKEALDGKFELIRKYNLAGMIIWEVTQDTPDHEMLNYISQGLGH